MIYVSFVKYRASTFQSLDLYGVGVYNIYFLCKEKGEETSLNASVKGLVITGPKTAND